MQLPAVTLFTFDFILLSPFQLVLTKLPFFAYFSLIWRHCMLKWGPI